MYQSPAATAIIWAVESAEKIFADSRKDIRVREKNFEICRLREYINEFGPEISCDQKERQRVADTIIGLHSPKTRYDKKELLELLRTHFENAPQIMGHDLRNTKPVPMEQDGTSAWRYLTAETYLFLMSPWLTFTAIRHQIILLFLNLTIRNPTKATFRLMTAKLLMVMRARDDATKISIDEKHEMYKKIQGEGKK